MQENSRKEYKVEEYTRLYKVVHRRQGVQERIQVSNIIRRVKREYREYIQERYTRKYTTRYTRYTHICKIYENYTYTRERVYNSIPEYTSKIYKVIVYLCIQECTSRIYKIIEYKCFKGPIQEYARAYM